MDDLISRQAVIDALHTWFRDGFDEDKWWNSTHVLAAIEGLPSAKQGYKWETCFECPLSHGCPKIKGCTNEQAIEYASQIPNDCPLSAQPEIIRCKDCKYWRQQTNYLGAPLSFGFCESDDMWRSLHGETYEVAHIDTDDDFYCGYAEGMQV